MSAPAPALLRPCAGCSGRSPFLSSGKFRVNGHHRRLDVWLVYRCMRCEHTYNLPVHERAHARSIHDLLPRYHRNDTALAHDIATCSEHLRRSRSRLVPFDKLDGLPDGMAIGGVAYAGTSDGMCIVGPRPPADAALPWHIELVTRAAYGLRTDRVLAHGLGWSRSRTRRALRAGVLAVTETAS